MSGDELIVFLVCGFLAVWSWYAWYLPPVSVERLGAPSSDRWLLVFLPILGMALLFAVLKVAAAQDVRDDAGYLAFYMVMGAAWIGTAMKLLPFIGLSPREDAVERNNGAAAAASGGAMIGCTLCFAGGNIGNGPGWWVVVFSAGLATGALAVLWLLLDALARIGDTVTIDRDPAAGLRAAGLLIAMGLILGRAVAGDWVSASATLRDFAAMGWPAVAVVAVAIPLERAVRPTPDQPAPSPAGYGALPAALYLAVGISYVVYLGRPT